MHGKVKPGIAEIAKAWAWTPSCQTQRADAHWVFAYSHKTESFIKNKGQQKSLDNKCADQGHHIKLKTPVQALENVLRHMPWCFTKLNHLFPIKQADFNTVLFWKLLGQIIYGLHQKM